MMSLRYLITNTTDDNDNNDINPAATISLKETIETYQAMNESVTERSINTAINISKNVVSIIIVQVIII